MVDFSLSPPYIIKADLLTYQTHLSCEPPAIANANKASNITVNFFILYPPFVQLTGLRYGLSCLTPLGA